MFARFIGFGVGHKSQYQSEEKMGRIVRDGDPEDENDPPSEDLPDETESVVSFGEEIEENDDGDVDDREDINGDGDVGDIGEDVEEDESEDDIDETASEDSDELDFEF